MKKTLTRFLNFIFIRFLAKHAAERLRKYLPTLGMTADEFIVFPSTTKFSGLLKLSGFGIPRFDFEMFARVKNEIHPLTLTIYLNARNELELRVENVIMPIPFTDVRALPIVNVLKSVLFVFPYSLFMTTTKEDFAKKTPKTVG